MYVCMMYVQSYNIYSNTVLRVRVQLYSTVYYECDHLQYRNYVTNVQVYILIYE